MEWSSSTSSMRVPGLIVSSLSYHLTFYSRNFFARAPRLLWPVRSPALSPPRRQTATEPAAGRPQQYPGSDVRRPVDADVDSGVGDGGGQGEHSPAPSRHSPQEPLRGKHGARGCGEGAGSVPGGESVGAGLGDEQSYVREC